MRRLVSRSVLVVLLLLPLLTWTAHCAEDTSLDHTEANQREMIRSAYRNVLLRDPDRSGWNSYGEILSKDPDVSREWIEETLAQSEEGRLLQHSRKKGPQRLRSAAIVILLAISTAWFFLKKKLGLKTATLLFLFLYPPFLVKHGFEMRDIRYEDLPSFYGAARVTFTHRASPYTWEAQKQIARETDGPVFPYLYPPTSLPIFYPLAGLSFDAAKDAMLVLNHLLSLGAIVLCFFFLKQVTGTNPSELVGAVCVLFCFLFDPIRSTIFHGQINLVVLCALLAFHLLLSKGRELPAMLFLALAIVLKTYPAVLVLLLLAQRRYRAVISLGVVLLAWLVMSAALLPGVVWGDWFEYVLPFGGYGRTVEALCSPANIWNQNLNGFFVRLFMNGDSSNALFNCPVLARALTYLCSVVLLALSTWLCHRVSKAHSDRFAGLEFALYLTVVFLISPLSWFHHLVFILPACFVVIHLSLTRYRSGKALLAWAALSILAWNWYLWPDSAAMLREGWTVLLASSRFYGVMVILGLLIAELRYCRTTTV